MVLTSMQGMLAQAGIRVRMAGAAVQQLVEILQPGPLEGRARRWEHDRRLAAEQAVGQAIDNWTELQQAKQINTQDKTAVPANPK